MNQMWNRQREAGQRLRYHSKYQLTRAMLTELAALRNYRCQRDEDEIAQALIHAAASNIRSHSHFGAFYRRLKGRLGEAQALIATAHKIARVIYVMLKEKQPYRAMSEREYEAAFRERELQSLQRRAARLGLSLIPTTQLGAVS